MKHSRSSQVMDGLTAVFATSGRTPILRRPDEYGMAYEDIFFPSLDGVGLEGWFIPSYSDHLVICSHCMSGNRYGYPGHLEPWTSFSGVEVNFLPMYKALHDAGYNVLAYDLRNHGVSGSGNGGIVGIGFEYRDIIGSLRYAETRLGLRKMRTGLLSVCLGCDATMVGMNRHPEQFEHVKALLGLQPVSARPFIEQASEVTGVPNGVELSDKAIHQWTGIHLNGLSPITHAKAVRMPTLLVQVRDEVTTKPSDVETIYDNISTKDKKLFWIEGTTRRFDGYNYLGEHPELMLEWFKAHMN